MTISKDLIIAINNLCSGSETKILLATLCGDVNSPAIQIQKMAGITKTSNYFRTRKQLLNLGYLILDNGGMHVNIDKILSDYRRDLDVKNLSQIN